MFHVSCTTLFFVYEYNIYKKIEVEICEIFNYVKNKGYDFVC